MVVTGNVFTLDPAGADTFNLVGVAERIHFARGEAGTVNAVSDSQGTYPLRRKDIPADIDALFTSTEMPDYAYAPPAVIDNQSTADARNRGLNVDSLEAIVNDINRGPDYANVHSLLLSRKGDLVLEEYFMGFDADQAHNLRSATKSVIATLVGIAIGRGEASLDDRPLARIADERNLEISTHKAQLTLAEMLDMRHGLQCDDWVTESPGNESKIYGQDDWTDFILNIPDAATDTDPTYCSAMLLMVGRYLRG